MNSSLCPGGPFPLTGANCGPEWPARIQQQLTRRKVGLLSEPPVLGTHHHQTRACWAPGSDCGFPFSSFSFFKFLSWLLVANGESPLCWRCCGKIHRFLLVSRKYWKLQGREESAGREGGRRNTSGAIQLSWEICILQLTTEVGYNNGINFKSLKQSKSNYLL